MICYGYDPLQNGRVIFGVGVDFEAGVCLGSVHVVLDIHYFLKYTVNICLCEFDFVKMHICLPNATLSLVLLLFARS